MTDSYDEIPYQSIPFTDSDPENLAALGQMFGLDAPDPTRARVLELGCASGGNLVPMAFRLPEGRFLGVELAARQVQDGQRLLAELGLDNIRIEQADFHARPGHRRGKIHRNRRLSDSAFGAGHDQDTRNAGNRRNTGCLGRCALLHRLVR